VLDLNQVATPLSKQSRELRPQFLAGELALDFLNTRMRVQGRLLDLLQTGADVAAWLAKAGLQTPRNSAGRDSISLLRAARLLRENIRSLVEKRKAGRRGDPSVLNRFLKCAPSHPRLEWKAPGSLTIERIQQQDRPEAALAPVAEAAANLLALADFKLVRRCEDETCVLWFFDQTKSHRRRWCSMELCGNRHKVAAYRARRRDRRPPKR
jgi:predicted RNA-binding Zn ribbon-like protein